MSDKKITPALTKDAYQDDIADFVGEDRGVHLQQWAKCAVWSYVHRGERDEETGAWGIVITDPRPYEGKRVLDYAPDATHALAALCLYGQPFGFTARDVKNLRDMVPDQIFGPDDPTSELHNTTAAYEWLESLAARISALLPPEEG